MSNFRIASENAILMCDAMLADLDGVGTNASLEFYTGSQPTDPEDVAAGTLVATIALQNPAFGAAVSPNGATVTPFIARATLAGVPLTGAVSVTDTITWFRCMKASGLSAFDGSVGTSDADIILDVVSVVAGDTISVDSLLFDQPEGPPMSYAVQKLPLVTQAASGYVHDIGSIAQTLPVLTQAVTGTYIGRNGPITQTLPVLTQTATGTDVDP